MQLSLIDLFHINIVLITLCYYMLLLGCIRFPSVRTNVALLNGQYQCFPVDLPLDQTILFAPFVHVEATRNWWP